MQDMGRPKSRYIKNPKEEKEKRRIYMKEYNGLYKKRRIGQTSDLTGYIFTTDECDKILNKTS